MRCFILISSLALTACQTPTVIEERFTEVKVPVTVPCVRDTRPTEVVALKDKVDLEQWNQMTTDQREKLLLAKGLDRKVYSEELYVSTAGCE